jgi:hypothetical protein
MLNPSVLDRLIKTAPKEQLFMREMGGYSQYPQIAFAFSVIYWS